MHILFVKLTSMGDLIHALPALTDAKAAIPDLMFDWVIDKNFSEIATWHPAVKNIITTSHRQWRQDIWQTVKNKEVLSLIKTLRQKKYDMVIDGQSNLKSGIVMLFTRGERHGYDKVSARGKFVSLAYNKHHFVHRRLPAITRLRMLLSQSLNYPLPTTPPDFQIANYPFPPLTFELPQSYLVFVHNVSWQSRLWPENYWRELVGFAAKEGLNVLLPWGNEAEKHRASRITEGFSNAQVLPFCSLSEMAQILKNSQGVICGDTGLGHLTGALNVPALTMYGPTDIELIRTAGQNQHHMVSPFVCTKCYRQICKYRDKIHSESLCLMEIKPQMIWQKFFDGVLK